MHRATYSHQSQTVLEVYRFPLCRFCAAVVGIHSVGNQIEIAT